jgi:acetylornithine aminotransferase
MTDALMHTYKRLPVTFTRGEGAWLWDHSGRRYLDALSGIAVCNLGHAHPAVTQAVCEQAGQLVHTSNLYGISNQQRLGETLTQLAGMDRVFFANSGAEANEAAIKLARLHGHNKGVEVPLILVAEQSFHGRTMATLTATGNAKVQAGFEPLLPGFVRVPFGDADAIRKIAAEQPGIVALLVEPVQGEGGVNIPPADYLNQLRALCDDHDWLLMLDEIQTGMGRTGQLFAHQHNGVIPDVLTLAKALGNGVPIGACLAKGKAADILGPGSHGSTFGGNPLACAAAQAVCDTLQADGLAAQAGQLGAELLDGFRSKLAGVAGVREIRGLGLMIGIELDRPCAELVGRALQHGLLINVTADKVIRLLPPLIMDRAQAEQLINGVATLVKDFLAND